MGIDAVSPGYDKHEITWATYVIFFRSKALCRILMDAGIAF